MILPSVSLSDLIGESAFTYQNRSLAPVVSAPITRTGAPLANAPSTPMTPAATPMSAQAPVAASVKLSAATSRPQNVLEKFILGIVSSARFFQSMPYFADSANSG